MFYVSNLPPQRVPNNKRRKEGLARLRSFGFKIPRATHFPFSSDPLTRGIVNYQVEPQSQPTPETVEKEKTEDAFQRQKNKGSGN